MRNGMHVTFGAVTLSFLLGLEAAGQFDAPPQQPAQDQAPPQQAEPAQPAQPPPAQAQPAPQGDFVATVNGEPITRAEFDDQVQSALRAHRQQAEGRQPTPQEVRQIYQQVFDGLVEARLIEQYAREQGPEVGAAEIDKVLEGLKKNLQAQGLTLDQYLAASNQTAEVLRKRVAGSLAWRKLQQQRMSPDKLREFYEDHRQRFGEATFDEVQAQVVQLYTTKIWDDVVQQMKPKAEIEIAAEPQDSRPQTPPRRMPPRQPETPPGQPDTPPGQPDTPPRQPDTPPRQPELPRQ